MCVCVCGRERGVAMLVTQVGVAISGTPLGSRMLDQPLESDVWRRGRKRENIQCVGTVVYVEVALACF